MNEPALYPRSRRWLEKKHSFNLRFDKEATMKINLGYQMPMGPMDMDRFEWLNSCHIKVFR